MLQVVCTLESSGRKILAKASKTTCQSALSEEDISGDVEDSSVPFVHCARLVPSIQSSKEGKDQKQEKITEEDSKDCYQELSAACKQGAAT